MLREAGVGAAGAEGVTASATVPDAGVLRGGGMTSYWTICMLPGVVGAAAEDVLRMMPLGDAGAGACAGGDIAAVLMPAAGVRGGMVSY